MSEPKKYGSVRKKVKILIIDVEGIERPYFLQEMPGDELEAYLDENKDRFVTDIGADGAVKIQSINSYKGMYSSLLKRAMLDIDGVSVTEEFVNGLPFEARKDLFADAQEINALTAEAEAEVKN